MRQAQGLEKTAFSPIRKEIGVLRKKRKRRQRSSLPLAKETDEVSSMADETAIRRRPSATREIFKEQRCKLCHSSSRDRQVLSGQRGDSLPQQRAVRPQIRRPQQQGQAVCPSLPPCHASGGAAPPAPAGSASAPLSPGLRTAQRIAELTGYSVKAIRSRTAFGRIRWF